MFVGGRRYCLSEGLRCCSCMQFAIRNVDRALVFQWGYEVEERPSH